MASRALSACHPGNQEAKLLRESCDSGSADARNKFAAKLQKGEYVLPDEPRAAGLFDTAGTRGIGDGCGSGRQPEIGGCGRRLRTMDVP